MKQEWQALSNNKHVSVSGRDISMRVWFLYVKRNEFVRIVCQWHENNALRKENNERERKKKSGRESGKTSALVWKTWSGFGLCVYE